MSFLYFQRDRVALRRNREGGMNALLRLFTYLAALCCEAQFDSHNQQQQSHPPKPAASKNGAPACQVFADPPFDN